MLIISTKGSKLNMFYFEGFKEFKAIAVTGNVFSIYSQKWNLISHIRMVTSKREPQAQALIVLGLGVHFHKKLPFTGRKFWNLKISVSESIMYKL